MQVNHENFENLFGEMENAISHAPQKSAVIKNVNCTEFALPGHTIKNEDGKVDYGLLVMCIEHTNNTKSISFHFIGKKRNSVITIESNASSQDAHIISLSEPRDYAERLFNENCEAVLMHLLK